MQAGEITVDGRQIGVVTVSYTNEPDESTPAFADYGTGAAGAEAPISGHRVGHPHAGHSGTGSPTHASMTPEQHKHNSIRYGHHSAPESRVGRVTVRPGDDPRGNEAYIREKAREYGHDPDTAVAVAKSEGLRDFSGDRGTSFGAFQLHKHGGLGDEFQKQTGLDPADPKNERATIDWSMKNLGRTGWAPYHGARNRYGLGDFEGVGGRSSKISASDAKISPAGEAPQGLKGNDIKAFIVHHTGGRGTPEGVENTLSQRGLGVEYIMDRQGNITQAGPRGSSQIMPGWGKGAGLNNQNTVGMEVIAKDNSDVTPAQIAAGKAFIDKNYPDTPVMGHGEVNPGHKEADEGLAIANAVRSGRATAAADPETQAP